VPCHERRSRWPPHHHGAAPGAVPRPHGAAPPTRGAVVEARPRRRPSSEPAEVAATPVARAAARSRSGQGKAGSGLGVAGSAAPGRHRRHGGGACRASPPPRRERIRPERPCRRHPRGMRGAPGEPFRQRQGGGRGGELWCGARWHGRGLPSQYSEIKKHCYRPRECSNQHACVANQHTLFQILMNANQRQTGNNTHTFDPERNSPRWETLELHCREIKS
jgi:hypothetical protein